ncbi:TonB-dependent receptor [Brevundimonas subvibrioides]|uniref:TonB-dependent receptor n=1 Tax=Brevundimonas subvibrioides (strain ATCC 15264 / DSM 4735 / LMG 14903 / NBRC 16000 / CB 81) TaxID=633149 RepID=D9QKU8_BRESC|nr:TonB-dependent receptor [Brevundimonas subvibrioides]ADL01762.1 TonB-dependent receptor [Brevundimonas subvibrioides ATCC 15264]
MFYAPGGRTRAYRNGLVAGTSALAIALTLSVGAASAQTAPAQDEETQVDEIVVTGFRASLDAALGIKRREAGVVDVIVAEDIADFPDLNLAESIQRIPGVSLDRDAGEGRSLTVRGLSSDFTRTRINGMEAQATTGGSDSSGGANRGRGFDFNVFASELFNSITVRKTAAAETEEGSLGATIDLQAVRPFDYDEGFTFAASAQGGYNDLSETTNPRAAVLLSNIWGDGRFGALISAAYSERDLWEEGFSSVRWAPAAAPGSTNSGGFCSPVGVTPQNPGNSTANGSSAANCAVGVARPANTASNVAAYNTANQANVFIPRLPRYGRLTHHQERLGVTGAFQFKPDDATVLSLDVLYSKLDSTRQEDFLESLSFSRNAAAGGQTQIAVREAAVENGALVYGVFDNVDVRSEQRFDELTTEFTQVNFTAEHDFSDTVRGKFFIGRALSEYTNPVQTTVTLDRQNIQGYSFDFRGNPNTPTLNYGFDVASPANWQWRDVTLGTTLATLPRSEIRLRPNGVTTTFESISGDLEWDVRDWLTLKVGVNGKSFQSDSYEFRRTDETLVPALPAGTTVANISNVLTGFGNDLGGTGNATSWLRPDLNALASLFNIYCNCNTGVAGGDFTLTGVTNGNARGGNRTIREDDFAYYAQADFNTELMGVPFRGNFGVRQVRTELDARGFSSTGGGTRVSGTNTYEDTLPSLNLAIEPAQDLIVRFAAAKVMARPQIGNTLAGTNYLVPTTSLSTATNFTASIGNVDLEPFRAKTYDLSVEWYFTDEALISFAYFYKDIDTYIQIIRQDLPYTALTALNPTAFDPAFCTTTCSGSTVFQLTSAVNTEGGPLKGFEISYQQPFTFLPGFLQYLGVQANYTHVESEIDYCNDAVCSTFVTNDLINLSPAAYNGTLYYDDDRFSARISAAYRDEYLQNVPGRNGNLVEGKIETLNIDVSSSFKLTDQITLTFEGLNLTDEDNHQYVGDDNRQSTSVYNHTGRQYYFGARYAF